MSHSGYALNIGESDSAYETKKSNWETPISIQLFVVIVIYIE